MTFFFTYVFMFMVFWRPQEWLFTWLFGFPVLDVVVGLSMGSLLVEYNEGRVRLLKDTPQLYLLVGLWLAAPLSHIAHTYFVGMMDSIAPVFKICLFSFLLFAVLDRPGRLRTAAILFVFMALVMVLHAYLQVRNGYGFAGYEPYYIPQIGDTPAHFRTMFFGIFEDPNDMAQFLATCVPLTFALTRRMDPISFVLGCVLAWCLVWGVLTTHSRGGIIGLVAVAATQILLWLPGKWFPYLLGVCLLGALALCPFSGGILDQSAHERVVFWGLANQAFKRTPVFGLGYDMFWQVTRKGNALHNAFVNCYTELGLVGYWFWFGLILLGIVGAWRTRMALKGSKNPEALWLRRLAGQSMAAMMGFCGSAYFLSRTFVFPLFFLSAMLGVMPIIARRYLPEEAWSQLAYTRKRVIRLLTIGSLTSVGYIYVSIILLNKAWGY